eukprot:CAMPEP_0185726570 /NCGR_PEP_ID=MMETSP1171-20130828/2513_1 /TAXON_ID=374046 /ORGANISM="Helicotheca tamensis, Strain CCMP826" /LENGTH=352 /DNA_ID=CAMNT_0028394953 /DNA_START=134 /DNA_END=1192 /DNA_ORIENTATION=-
MTWNGKAPPSKMMSVAVMAMISSSLSLYIDAFSPSPRTAFTSLTTTSLKKSSSMLYMSSSPPPSDGNNNNEDEGNEEGSSLAAEFAAMAKIRSIGLESEDLDYDDDDDDDDDDDESTSAPQSSSSSSEEDEDDEDEEEEMNIPEGAIEAFIDSDSQEGVSNKQVYDELRERVLDTAGGFVELVGSSASDDDDDDDDDDKAEEAYKTPTTVPDSGLTAGEVVTTVLDALKNNDNPTPNRGVEVLFGYSSPTSQITELQEADGLTPAEYANFLKEDSKEYQVLFHHSKVFIDKADYSFDRKRAFFTARLSTDEKSNDFTNVNFILSTNGQGEDDCWLIDSMLIRPEGMRRRRRR